MLYWREKAEDSLVVKSSRTVPAGKRAGAVLFGLGHLGGQSPLSCGSQEG